MQFLAIKKHSRQRQDGKEHAQALVVKKNRKFGEVLEQKCISTRKPVLITGAHASGKSYWLDRLHEEAGRVWARIDSQPMHIAATRPLSAWTDTKQMELWWAGRHNPEDDRHWMKLKAWERADWLPEYLRETGAVLFVDDAHQLAGRKLKLAQDCIRAAKVWVMTASEEGRISPGLRKDVLAAEPQIFRLDTEVAYDATNIVMLLAILGCLLSGAYEIGFIMAGLKLLSGGLRASKQN